MNRAVAVVAAIVLLSPGSLYALYTVENRGSWPESWPKELEGLREQSRTLLGPMAPERHYAIPFAERESFEAVWPHLLKVKTPWAPLLLRRPPGFGLLDDSKAGVCIHTPPEGEAPLADAKQAGGDWRRTIYIELIVDGDIVDLNRIPLPPDTPIIDERFKDGATQDSPTTDFLGKSHDVRQELRRHETERRACSSQAEGGKEPLEMFGRRWVMKPASATRLHDGRK